MPEKPTPNDILIRREQAIKLVTLVGHPLVEHSLAFLRDKNTALKDFREHARRITRFLAFKLTEDLKLGKKEIETPIEITEAFVLSQNIVLIPVLRAGLSMVDEMIEILPDATIGYDGLKRDEQTAVAQRYYEKLPPIDEKTAVIILDPMLATGGSACETINLVKKRGAKEIRLACIVAAPEGILLLNQKHPDVRIFTCAVDRELNDAKYILPGLGDFGDRYHGTT